MRTFSCYALGTRRSVIRHSSIRTWLFLSLGMTSKKIYLKEKVNFIQVKALSQANQSLLICINNTLFNQKVKNLKAKPVQIKVLPQIKKKFTDMHKLTHFLCLE